MAEKQGNPPTTHTVKDNDKLFDIAKVYYGDGNKWPKIAEANGNLKPEDLKPGQKLQIP
jgi:nucleoid-associated protein YgaU